MAARGSASCASSQSHFLLPTPYYYNSVSLPALPDNFFILSQTHFPTPYSLLLDSSPTQKTMAASLPSADHNLPFTQPVCQNCQTSTTPLWRRDEAGSVLCNACGLFLKLHGRPRPISLKTDVIKSRNRVKTASQAPKKKVCCPQAPVNVGASPNAYAV